MAIPKVFFLHYTEFFFLIQQYVLVVLKFGFYGSVNIWTLTVHKVQKNSVNENPHIFTSHFILLQRNEK